MLFAALATAALGFVPSAELPPLLTSEDGSHIAKPTEWPQRRDELKTLLQQHILGTLPEHTPPLIGATLLNSSTSPTMCSAHVKLAYRCNASDVTFDVELVWPCAAAASPVPLFLTQWNHRSWGLLGVQRGYMMALYPGSDVRDASDPFRAAYPEASMRKILARAFVASRTLDFLLGPHYEKLGTQLRLPTLDTGRVCIGGHSRNGKQSLVAAAFDERITAVVGSSSGAPIGTPIRYSSPDYNGEPLVVSASESDWFLPSLTAYFGREHELPADGHMVLALIAPRHALVASAHNDHSGDPTFGIERGVTAAAQAYRLLNAPEALRIRYRPGRHHGFVDVHSYFDWFDRSAGKPGYDADFPPDFELHAFDWQGWNASHWPHAPSPKPSAPLAERVISLLGGLGTGATGSLVGGNGYCEEGGVPALGDSGGNAKWSYASSMMMHNAHGSTDRIAGCMGAKCKYNVSRVALSFGAYVTANLYVPNGAPGPLPVVIFLHGQSYHMGYTGAYGLLESESTGGLILAIAARGAAVLAFDLVGMGARQAKDGTARFYRRYPTGSRLGAMVGEVHAALDMIHCASPAGVHAPECLDGSSYTHTYPPLNAPLLDESRVFLLGYSLGATVALHAAALAPPRAVAGVAAFSGWTPMRTGGGGLSTGGNRRIFETLALMPRLGLYASDYSTTPYDYDELLAALAPRPLLLYCPLRDRFANATDVAKAIEAARPAWRAAPEALETQRPDAPSDFKAAELTAALGWIERVVLKGRMSPPAPRQQQYVSAYGVAKLVNETQYIDTVNIVLGEGPLDAKLSLWEKFKVPSLYGVLDPKHEIFQRHVGLHDGWEQKVEEIVTSEILPNFGPQKALRGVFLGDEICCHNATCWDLALKPVSEKLRALLGPSALLYTNECPVGEDWSSTANVPPELDLFGYDIYRGWWIGGSPKEELEETQKIYAKLFAKLQPHQRAVVVGQGFACSNTSAYPLEQQDEVVAEKLELAFEWAKAEPRIAAINPWHWGTRHRAQHSGVCDMRLGMEVLPKAIEKLREIRKFMGPLHY